MIQTLAWPVCKEDTLICEGITSNDKNTAHASGSFAVCIKEMAVQGGCGNTGKGVGCAVEAQWLARPKEH